MATIPNPSALGPDHAVEGGAPLPSGESDAPRRTKRRNTSHLKLVPQDRAERDALRQRCADRATTLDRSRPLTKDELERLAREILTEAGQSEGYVGWTMVVLASEFWREQVAAVPFERRLFLLPHCLKHAEGCPADYDEFGLDCKQCGACSIADFRTAAEELGYKVLVAEGSPVVLKIIVSGYVDAIVGVACLNVLEKAIDKILLAGIPCMAVPLLSSDCRNTSVDEDLVSEMVRLEHAPPETRSRTYMHLLRAAAAMCEPPQLDRLVKRQRSAGPASGAPATLDPIAGTETLALDFLAKGGKHSRPFITLAVYDALTGDRATGEHGAEHLAGLSDSVKRAALSIETFHKASLVHDDIEDDDPFRYGDDTLHRRYGVPTAINVGDYLIGLGYRLVAGDTAQLGADVAADILHRLSEAHLRLSEGQGAELLWRDGPHKRLSPLDALKIYALKTAPAFEAALYSGLRLAGPVGPDGAWVGPFARYLGVAFQILNDLQDWQGDGHNKLFAGGDVLGGRPTVLWALALEALDEAGRAELESLVAGGDRSEDVLARVRALYRQADVFDKAVRLIEKHRERALSVVEQAPGEPLQRLLRYLIDTVLEQPAAEAPPPVVVPVEALLTMRPAAT